MQPLSLLARAALVLALATLLPLPASAQSLVTPGPSASPTLPVYDYSAIDQHAKAAPKEAEQSVQALAAYLARGAKNDREKARAIFTWIIENVVYDWDMIAKGAREDGRPDVVMKTKLAACLGHATLFDALAKSAGLKTTFIAGRTRELDLDPLFARASVKGSNGVYYPTHAWNAVQIDGKWCLVDVTHCNGKGKKKDVIETSWPSHDSLFLVPPTDLIYIYFPDNPQSQFLARPLSRNQHEGLPVLGVGAFRHHVQVEKPMGPILNIDDKVQLSLKAPASEDVMLATSLIYGRKEVKGPYTLTQRQGEKVEVTASMPVAGTFLLRVFAGRKDGAKVKQWDPVVDYRVVAKKGDQEMGLLPLLADLFTERKCYLHGPLTGVLAAGKPVAFKVAVPGAEKVYVTTNGLPPKELEGKDGVFSGEATPPAGNVFIEASFQPNMVQPLVAYKAK